MKKSLFDKQSSVTLSCDKALDENKEFYIVLNMLIQRK